MKKILIYPILFCSFVFTACNLEREPLSEYSEKILGTAENDSNKLKFATKAEMKTQYDRIYSGIQGNFGQEVWFLDGLLYAEVRADNAYAGAADAIIAFEQHSYDQSHGVCARDWRSFFFAINLANQIICNVDSVPDPALTEQERKEWKAEAKVLRAWIMFDMVRLWGDIPIQIEETPQISSENIEEIYPLLFPGRKKVEDVYKQIVQDLTESLDDLPSVDLSNKFKITKPVGNALLAKVYAEKPIRDYSKTIEYCEAVEADGFELNDNYSDLFSVNDEKTDVSFRNTKESIFEIVFPSGSGSWVTWMFGLDLCDPKSTYNWAKWITPSRDLIKAFDQEGDLIRKNESIVWGAPSWSIYYPSDHYPFMYKTRSRYNSIIKLRLADILLLKAEAYVALNQLSNAAELVNKVRSRVSLSALSSDVSSSQEKMKDAVLRERRLELAYEGHRWFDLVRNDKVIELINTLNQRDPGRLTLSGVLDENRLLLPIPQNEIDKNPSLTQNKGY